MWPSSEANLYGATDECFLPPELSKSGVANKVKFLEVNPLSFNKLFQQVCVYVCCKSLACDSFIEFILLVLLNTGL